MTKHRRQRGTGSVFLKPLSEKEKQDGLRRKNWFIQYYRNGRRIREGTGSDDYDAAKKLLRQRLHEIDQGQYVERRGKPARVKDLYELLETHNFVNKRGRKRELPGRWKHLEPVFGARLATEITTDDVMRYVRDRQEKEHAANATINRELSVLKRMFRLGYQSTPPKVLRVPYIPMLKENNVRSGFVEDEDFARLVFVADTGEPWLRLFLELGYSYGWREGELLGLRVRQVNLVSRTIRLDPGTTKNREGREVAMTSKVFELLRAACARKSGEDYVLTRRGSRSPIKDFRGSWRSLCIRAELGSVVCRKCGRAAERGKRCECGSRARRKYRGLIPHDLRRSAAKAARAAGVPESLVMSMGGWKTAAMFRRYAIVSSADQRAAVEMLERARLEREQLALETGQAHPSTILATAKPQ